MISFDTNDSGFSLLKIKNAAARATISPYGGQILSFIPEDGDDLLFLSRESFFSAGKAIRGGIPVCWPWFGPHPRDAALPQHGFVRTMPWRLAQTEETADSTNVILECVSTSETRALWPHDFRLAISFSVGKTLKITLTTTNTGGTPFAITDALHTYFRIGDISLATVIGLEGATYLDRVGPEATKEQEGAVSVSGETDRVYYSATPCSVVDESAKKRVTVEKVGFPDTIVWNPWIDRAKSMADFGDDEYKTMLCAEAGSVRGNAINVAPGVSVTQRMALVPVRSGAAGGSAK
jgi:glucose-6-phosphate 1-epimerase